MTVTPVPSDLPRIVFTDIDGETLAVRPTNDSETYYTQIVVTSADSEGQDRDAEVWLTARQTMALAQVLEATAATIGAAALIAGAPLFSDDHRPAFELVEA